MTQVYWVEAGNGAFADAANWSGDQVPGPADVAVLGPIDGQAFTVVSAGGETVAGVETGQSTTFSIMQGVFTATNGTDGGANLGRISVTAAGALQIDGAFMNSGVIALGSNGGVGALIIGVNPAGADATISGGGQITLGANADLYAYNAIPFGAARMTNVDNTISGEGTVGADDLITANLTKGVIQADGASAMTLQGTIFNSGLIAASGPGAFVVEGEIDDVRGGRFSPGQTLTLNDGAVLHGTLTLAAGADVAVKGVDNRLAPARLVNDGTIAVGKQARLEIQGAVDNAGQIDLAAGTDTYLAVGPGATMLSGGGTLNLGSGVGSNVVAAAPGATLVNVDNTITGAGNLGGGLSALENDRRGVIAGDGLVIELGGGAITNAGRIEAVGADGVTIVDAMVNNGALEAEGANLTVTGAVTGSGKAVISGGTMAFVSAFTQDVVFKGAAGVLDLGQSQGYGGTISGFSRTGGTSLDLADIAFVGPGEATFAGDKTGGVLTVTDGVDTARINLRGNFLSSTFVTGSDGHGGVSITAVSQSGGGGDLASSHRFIAAAAALAPEPAAQTHAGPGQSLHEPLLASPLYLERSVTRER